MTDAAAGVHGRAWECGGFITPLPSAAPVSPRHPAYRAMPKDATIRAGLEFGKPAARQKEAMMPDRSSGSMITITLAAAAVAALSLPLAMAQTPAKSGAAQDSTVKTPWGEPDLQGHLDR